MKDREFRALLDLFMCSDPWPVSKHPRGDGHEVIKELLNRKARRHGYRDWVHAYHEFR